MVRFFHLITFDTCISLIILIFFSYGAGATVACTYTHSLRHMNEWINRSIKSSFFFILESVRLSTFGAIPAEGVSTSRLFPRLSFHLSLSNASLLLSSNTLRCIDPRSPLIHIRSCYWSYSMAHMTLHAPRPSEPAHSNCCSNVTQTMPSMQAIHQLILDCPTPQTQRTLARPPWFSPWSAPADTS